MARPPMLVFVTHAACYIAIGLAILPVSAAMAGTPLLVGDFESCNLQAEAQIWHGAEAADPDRLAIVRRPVRQGLCALRMELRPNDRAGGGRNRIELKYDPGYPEGSDVFVAWSFLIPKSYPDTPRNQSMIMGQWKAEVPGEKHGPVLAVKFGKRGEISGIRIRYGVKGKGKKSIADVPIALGKWHDLALHLRWSRQNDGFIEARFDAQPITPGPIFGANMSAPVPHRFKLGQYAGKGKVRAPSFIIIDEVRIGDSWQDVSPER